MHFSILAMRLPKAVSLAACFPLLALGACGFESALPSLPAGVQTLTGTIVPTTMSTARRGTHLLKESGTDRAYLESSVVLLREFQGRTTALRGHFEHNIDPRDLPVFIVESVLSSEETVRAWASPDSRVQANIPTRWGLSMDAETTHFIPAGSLHPVVSIVFLRDKSLPSGIALTVGDSRAIRFLDDISGEQRIAVEQPGGYLEVSFTPQRESDPELARSEWLTFLRSIRLRDVITVGNAASSRVSGATASRDRQPCGGVAGVLCPPGQFCEITDLDQNIGLCRSVE